MARIDLNGKMRWIVCGFSFALFVIACTLPSLEFRAVSLGIDEYSLLDENNGAELLVGGWAGVIAGQYAWLANVTLLFGWIAYLKRSWLVALLLAIASLAIAAHLFFLVDHGLPAWEYKYYLEHPLVGCFVWLASMGSLVVGSLVGWWQRSSRVTLSDATIQVLP